MVNPVPGHNVSTPYGKRGSYWSCDEDSNGNGIHTGVDYAAPSGTPVVAARGGKVVHCNHGSAFGSHQIEILPGDGTRDFYAHMPSRVANGVKVSTGQRVGAVGAEGNVTGPHLHFERHKVATGGWSCGVVVDPAPSINAGGGSTPPPPQEEDPMPKTVQASSNPMNLNGEWQLVDWESTWGADSGVIKEGDPGFNLAGAFVATLTMTVEADGDEKGVVYSRPIEGNFDGKGGAWQVTSTHKPAETACSGATTYHIDSRGQAVAKGDRLRFQVKGPKGMRAASVQVAILFWD